jgi:hypothetical protein
MRSRRFEILLGPVSRTVATYTNTILPAGAEQILVYWIPTVLGTGSFQLAPYYLDELTNTWCNANGTNFTLSGSPKVYVLSSTALLNAPTNSTSAPIARRLRLLVNGGDGSAWTYQLNAEFIY